ncbi:MAG TPA: alpha/beta hydrolase [Anaerolineales bacterium]
MNEKTQMDAILIHGMGRTPLAMSILATRLRISNIRPHLFGYSVTFERQKDCFQRLEHFITKRVKTNEYIIIGHSLGAVLMRAILPRLIHKPVACFLLASPTQACKAARHFAPYHFTKLLGGEIGQLLANPQFMQSLPPTGIHTKIYAGTGAPRGRYSPFGEEANDGVLTLTETWLPNVPIQTLHVLHTFIMNSRVVTQDIVKIAKSHST